eukprot:CAMPEP_0114507938 /NCGR_PEP_ID=MMETSP0109-20121206/12304_1 /TAXON_ID=29199 /ORGANISM="Chlorarachnion reptans, Strain CCCM449" /LENGTH=291 /DNA_ID=CAMNT_0001686779 /DNA_START=79 /DNA_END=954 /DNA_ORIENTATION=-
MDVEFDSFSESPARGKESRTFFDFSTDVADFERVDSNMLLSPMGKDGQLAKHDDDIWMSFMGSPEGKLESKGFNLGSPTAKDLRRIKSPEDGILHQEEKKIAIPALEKRQVMEKKAPQNETTTEIRYKGLLYIGPTAANRPSYKSKQAWEHTIYPHGISVQNGRLRVQIKQKGVNPTYPHFTNTLQGLLDAAMFRDKETYRLWENGVLKRVPKYNFDHPDFKKPEKKKRRRRRRTKKAKVAASVSGTSSVSSGSDDKLEKVPSEDPFMHVEELAPFAFPPSDDMWKMDLLM